MIKRPSSMVEHEGEVRRGCRSRLARFGMLATSISGRKVYVSETDSTHAYTDGSVIYVPDALGAHPQASIVVQAVLLTGGSLDSRLLVSLVGRREVRDRYLTLEVARVASDPSSVVPTAVLRKIAAVYDGPLPGSPDQSIEWAASSRRRVPAAPDWYGVIRPLTILSHQGLQPGGTPSESDLRRALKASDSAPDIDDDDEGKYERPKLLSLMASSAIQNPLMGRFLQSILGAARTPATEDSGAIGLSSSELRQGRVGARAKQLKGGAEIATAATDAVASGSVGVRYPEWDCYKGRYRRDHCAVAEYAIDTTTAKPLLTVDGDPQLLRQLARINLCFERHRGQFEGDSIDVDAVVRHLANSAAGGAGERRVYVARRRSARDLGVMILLDASSSTQDAASGMRIFDEQRRVVAKLATAFDQLGDQVAVFAFYSSGAGNVRFLKIKGYEERFGTAAQQRLSALKPSGFTRLGAAIRHATHLLNTGAGTRSRLLVVVGDGLPFDDGYEGPYAQDDSRKALSESYRDGVGCIGISVSSLTQAKVLERVWGHVAHAQLCDVSDLTRDVRRLVTDALRRANQMQRRIQSKAA